MHNLSTKNESDMKRDFNDYTSNPNKPLSLDIYDYQQNQKHRWLDDYGWL